jgi:exopolyphosphatase/guanosine-5'-triphosphate,3'-diphosphate pyrophosphatase
VRIGAVDIGTNSVRLLVADVDEQHRLRTAHRMGEISRLGEGLDRTGVIDEHAAGRTLDCIERFVQEAEYSGASRIRVAGTNALRTASNGPEVARRFSERIGYEVEILSGEAEARLVFMAVLSGLSSTRGRSVVVDIGGGSTEIITGEGDECLRVLSLELGCVRLSERFLEGDPPRATELERVRDHVRTVYEERLPDLNRTQVDRAVGVGGTVTAFAALDLGLHRYDPARIENHFLPTNRIHAIERQICGLPLEERRVLPGVSRGRADVIPAGSVILSEFVKRFPVPGVHVSTRGLRYGLVLSEARRLEAGGGAPAGI